MKVLSLSLCNLCNAVHIARWMLLSDLHSVMIKFVEYHVGLKIHDKRNEVELLKLIGKKNATYIIRDYRDTIPKNLQLSIVSF